MSDRHAEQSYRALVERGEDPDTARHAGHTARIVAGAVVCSCGAVLGTGAVVIDG
jgi:hypothetical protein